MSTHRSVTAKARAGHSGKYAQDKLIHRHHSLQKDMLSENNLNVMPVCGRACVRDCIGVHK